MPITVDPVAKAFILDSFNVSEKDIWTAYADWVVLSDNSKYAPPLSQLGGVAPVALYVYLENGWRVRPQEANGVTIITGNLLVQGGGVVTVPTLGNFNTQVIMEAPLAAQAISVNTGSGVTPSDITAIGAEVNSVLADDFASISTVTSEIWAMLGLDPSDPITISSTSHLSSNLRVNVVDNGDGTTTLTRIL